MSPGSHAAGDGSFGRSASIQAGRAVLLIGIAVLIGVILLHRGGATASGGGPVAVGDTTPTAAQTPSSVGAGGTTPTTKGGGTVPPTTASLRAPQDIKVLVANGTTVGGLAGKISNLLHAKGYNTLASTNSSQKPPSTIVYFAPSYSADAAALVSKLNLAPGAVQAMPQPPPVTNLNGANILVVVGPDLANAAATTSAT